MSAKQVTSFSPIKDIGGRTELGQTLRKLKRAGVQVYRYRDKPMISQHFFRCVVGTEFVTLFMEGGQPVTFAHTGNPTKAQKEN